MSKLSQYANDWRNAPVVTSEYITPEDGSYRVIIEGVKYAECDKDGNETDPTFIYIFCILEGNCRGQKFRRFTTIRNEKSAGFFKGDLQKLGLPIPSDPEELPNVFMSAPGIVVDVTVKTRNVNGKDYKDVYFDKVIGRPQQQAMQQQMPPAYQPQQRQFTDARAQPPKGFYAQPPQPQGYPDDIPFDPDGYTGIRNQEIPF